VSQAATKETVASAREAARVVAPRKVVNMFWNPRVISVNRLWRRAQCARRAQIGDAESTRGSHPAVNSGRVILRLFDQVRRGTGAGGRTTAFTAPFRSLRFPVARRPSSVPQVLLLDQAIDPTARREHVQLAGSIDAE